MKITLNGDPFEVAGPLTVADLLRRLEIDSRRVAVEHNLVVLKRAAFDTTGVDEGDQVEIVNFVGGGCACGYAEPRTWKSEARHRRQFVPGVGPRRQ